MNHKEYVTILSENLKISKKKTTTYIHQITDIFLNTLKKEDIVVTNFGKFIHQEGKRPKFEPNRKLIKEINIK